MKTPTTPPGHVTAKHAAHLLNVPPQTISRWIREGALAAHKTAHWNPQGYAYTIAVDDLLPFVIQRIASLKVDLHHLQAAENHLRQPAAP
jgi:hypothetical protein